MWKKRALVAGAALGLLAVHVLVALRFLLDDSTGTAAPAEALPLDDAWIHLVYAQSFAGFEGFAYNPGELETGFTSPLWAILLTPLFWLRLPWDVSLVLVVKCVGIAVWWIAGIFGYRVGARFAGRGAGVVLALMIALDPWLAFGAVSGMEVPLACATTLAGFDYLAAQRWRAAGIGFALAIWSRPELAVVAIAAIAAMAWARRGAGVDRKPVRDFAIPPAIAAGLWAAWNVIVSGRLLPGAFYLKHQADSPLDAFSDAPAVLVDQLFDYPWLFAGSGLVAYAVGAWRITREPVHRDAAIALLASGPLWLLATIWAHRINEPLAFYWHRYLDAGLPLLLAPIAIGTWTCIGAGVHVTKGARARRDLAFAALALPLLALFAVTLPSKLERNAELQAWSAQNIEDLHVKTALWIAANTEPTDSIATHDAGALRFISQRHTVDMLGINTHRVLGAGLPRVLEQHPPRYLILIPAWYPTLARDPRLREVHRERAEHFVICDRCQQDELVVFEPRR
jgi:hypothetical protein